ncbi:BTAD domain-containing putative transcriptional regulator [Actinomadura syzygii]|uniref:BTAD domain-containing putative transcriptional regulator n=1 Tax=Actinomadura syzygii TaxID=1427538 RepID=UPI00165235A3|nr:BTAD domain-containing putative transcriptional regulator [Actinomadura syzygii]
MVTLAGDGSPLRFEILGRPAAWRDGRELDLGPGKQRAVLAVLLLSPNRPVPTSSIVEAVWGDEPPDNGVNVVQKYVAGLRRVLEPERSPRSPGRLLTLTGAGYALRVPPEGLDAELFQDRVREALAVRAAGDPARAESLLRDALSGWRGTALAGLNGSFFDAARGRLDEERAAALEACAETGLELGEHARLVPELIRLVAEYPLREGFRYLLMLALYRCGRQAEALAAYRDARDFFADEFGVEPGEQLQSLHVGILRADPALAPPPAHDTPPALADTPPVPADTPAVPAVTPLAPADDLPVPAAAGAAAAGFAPPDPLAAVQVRAGHVPTTVAAHSAAAVQPWSGVPVVGAAPALGWPPPPPAPGRRRYPWAVRCGLMLAPLLSFGTLTWAEVAYFAARRRSRTLGIMSVGYLVMTVVFFYGTAATDPEATGWWDVPMLFSVFVTTLGGSVHVALITSEPSSPDGRDEPGSALDVPLIERRVRRDQARSLVAHHPAVARELRIGRPDLTRTFDDGGLVDVNAAPEHVLAALPGLDPYHAKLIVLARTAHGPLASVDDLAVREILPFHTVHALRETLIAVPPDA